MDEHGTDALTLLRSQHLEVEALFGELEHLQAQAQGSDASYLEPRTELTQRVVRKLVTHSMIEEEHFYPALRECLAEGDELADHAVEEHDAAERLLARIEGMSPDNLEYDGVLRELIADVRAHVAYEEEQIFPRIRAALSPEDLADIGGRLATAMRTAPTHPHPHAPSPGSGLGRVAAKGAAALDRLRDGVTGRGD